jgi:hypothetical protein
MITGKIPDDGPGKFPEADEALGESQFSQRRPER